MGSGVAFFASNARTGERLNPPFHPASDRDLDEAVALAAAASSSIARWRAATGRIPARDRAQLEALGGALIERVMLETALPEGPRPRRA